MPPDASAEALHRSPELRLLLAVIVAGVALAFAGLEVLGERTDVLMLDFQQWAPVAETASPDAGAVFATLQSPAPAQRPFRLTLAAGGAGIEGGLAAVHAIAVEPEKRYCFRVFATAPDQPGATGDSRVEVEVNGRLVRRMTAGGLRHGRAITIDGIRPEAGRVAIQLAVRPAAGFSVAPTSELVRFEYAVLRACTRRSGG